MAPRRRRDYFNTLCAKTIFGIKDQLVVFSALVVSGIISAHAITKFFGSTGTVDWSNPATFASLFNMQVIGGLLFLSLIALERMNNETRKLLNQLDVVAVEISRVSSVETSAWERQEKSEEAEREKESLEGRKPTSAAELHKRMSANTKASFNSKVGEGFANVLNSVRSLADGVTELSAVETDIKKLTRSVLSRMEISTEYQYLQNIITELRDNNNDKKILVSPSAFPTIAFQTLDPEWLPNSCVGAPPAVLQWPHLNLYSALLQTSTGDCHRPRRPHTHLWRCSGGDVSDSEGDF